MKYAKFNIIFLAAISIFIVTALFLGFFTKKPSFIFVNNESELKKLAIIKEAIDSDKDGLKDWEENLWQTDITNPDSDNDGTNDGDEIKQNRDPLVKGPNDLLTPMKNLSSNPGLAEPSTLTAKIGIPTLNIIYQAMEDGAFSEDELMSVMNDFDALIQRTKIPARQYTLADLALTNDSSVEAVKKYANEFADLIKKYFDKFNESEMTILAKYAAQPDKKYLEQIKEIAGAYQKVFELGKNIKTPKDLMEKHLSVLNNFSKIADDLKDLEKTNSDPIMAISALKYYQTDVVNGYKKLAEINNYLKERKIAFEDKEPAKIFALYSKQLK